MSSKRINETERHELDVIDAIVRGGGEARPEDAALTDFALLVRNARPVPNHGEAAALDERAQGSRSAGKPRQAWIFKPAFAGACALILVLGVVGISTLEGSDQSNGPESLLDVGTTTAAPDGAGTPIPGEPNSATATPRASSSDLAQSVVVPEAGGYSKAAESPGVTSAEAPREVARNTRITLAADGDKIERLSDRVNTIVDRFGGYVANSKVRGGEGNRGRATFELMIPAAQYKPALAEISKLAHVRSRSQASEDITTTFNAAQRELDRWTKRVDQLEAKLAGAETDQQRVSIARQLSRANDAKRSAARQVRANRARVNYVPISLTIVADKTAADKDKGEIAKAFDKAGEILTAIAAVLIVVLAVLIPIALIGAAIWFGMRRWKRARTDRAIESATAAQPE